MKMLFRLTKSAKKEAEDWARQTKRTLGNGNVYLLNVTVTNPSSIVMEMIKQRKHTWISRPKRQRSTEQPVMPVEDNGGLFMIMMKISKISKMIITTARFVLRGA